MVLTGYRGSLEIGTRGGIYMKRRTIKKVVDNIERKIVTKAYTSKSRIEFFEDKELQLIIIIPENITNLEETSFRRKKYASIFKYYIDKGIQDLTYEEIEAMVNTQCRKCKIEFVFHNKNGINIEDDKDDEDNFYDKCFIASYQETINGVLFEVKSYFIRILKYRDYNELDKPDKMEVNSLWQRNISYEAYWNEYFENCVTIQVNGISYSMLEVMYDRINSDKYLQNRHFFEEGGTLFDITKKQNRLLTKNNILKNQKNFIKYIDFDGTIIV